MIFRSDVGGWNRPIQAMAWISEIEHAKKVCDFATSNSRTGIATGDFETLDTKIASSLMNIFNGDFRNESSTKKNKHKGSRCV